MQDHVHPDQNHTPLTPSDLAGMIDHTFLASFGPPEKIEQLCAEAIQYGFATVAVNPAEVGRCVQLLEGSLTGVCVAIGFPLGQNTVATKHFEIQDAIGNGATEVDMVINLRALQAGQTDLVAREIEGMVSICKPQEILCKTILETCYLTDEQKRTVCQIARDAGVDFVKTSTGFGTDGATVEDVRLMHEIAAPQVAVKASGGIRDLKTALAMIEAGATRIGTSSGVKILEAFKQT